MYFPCTIRYTIHFQHFFTNHLILLFKNNDINKKLFYPKSAYNSIDRHKMHYVIDWDYPLEYRKYIL